MRNKLAIISVIIVGLMAFCVPLFAHHGNAEFDVGKRVTAKGTVTKWFWANPHCFLSFDVNGENGSPVHWTVETQPPASIVHDGFSKETFKPGDKVTVTLEPVKNGRSLGRMLRVMLSDGTELSTGHLD